MGSPTAPSVFVLSMSCWEGTTRPETQWKRKTKKLFPHISTLVLSIIKNQFVLVKMASGSRRVPLLDVDPNIQVQSQTKSKRKRRARRIVEDTDSENEPTAEPTQETLSETDDDTPLVQRIKRKRMAIRLASEPDPEENVYLAQGSSDHEFVETNDNSENSESDLEDDDNVDTYELVDLAENINDDDLVDINDDAEDQEATTVTDGQTKYWVTRLIAISQVPPADITPFLNPGVSLPIVEANVVRFKSASQMMLQNTKDHTSTIDPTDIRVKEFKARAFSIGFWKLFEELEISELRKPLFGGISQEVMSLLGRPNLSPYDLLDLPTIDDNFRLWGVYINIVLDSSGNIVGIYIGSSVAYRTYISITGRVCAHLKNSAKPFDAIQKCEQSEHYRLTTQPGMTSNFRFIALFQIRPGNTAATVIAETIIMTYLSTLSWTYPEQGKLVAKMREGIPGLPDFSNLGLNRSIPFAHGFKGMPRSKTLHKAWLKENGIDNICMNCGREAPEDENNWVGWFLKRRCRACHSYRNLHGHEKHAGTYVSHKDHMLWLAEGNDDVCQNPLCQEPRRPQLGRRKSEHRGFGRFRGFGPESRCHACYRHRLKYGTEDPNPHSGKPFSKHQEWLDEGHDDVCGICQAPRPDQSHFLGWTGWLDASKCPSCTVQSQPTEDEDQAWVEEHGDTCAWCGVGAQFAKEINGRASNRRCRSCGQYRTKFKVEKPPEEIARGNKSVHEEWLSLGNRDECGSCGKPRVPKTFYGWRENTRCSACYKRERKQRVRDAIEELVDQEN
jgi:hypothetical protein